MREVVGLKWVIYVADTDSKNNLSYLDITSLYLCETVKYLNTHMHTFTDRQ